MKRCSKCGETKAFELFAKDKRLKDGLSSWCKSCSSKASAASDRKRKTIDPVYTAKRREKDLQWARDNRERCSARRAKRRAAELQAMPPWYPDEHEAVCALYRRAWQLSNETGIVHHVDHIVPLQGKNVSGLHCLANLQILTAQENLSKSNKHYA